MQAEQVVQGGYLRDWLATCDDMELPGEVGELNFEEPSMGEEQLGKEAGERLYVCVSVGVCDIKDKARDFPDGTVVKNLPANARNMSLIPGLGRLHMPRSS